MVQSQWVISSMRHFISLALPSPESSSSPSFCALGSHQRDNYSVVTSGPNLEKMGGAFFLGVSPAKMRKSCTEMRAQSILPLWDLAVLPVTSNGHGISRLFLRRGLVTGVSAIVCWASLVTMVQGVYIMTQTDTDSALGGFR